MSLPVALQLYSIRETLSRSFEDGVRRVAEMGYAGVEPAGFPGTTPEVAGKLFEELGLAVPAAHAQLPLGEHKNEVLDAMAAIGCPRLICPVIPRDLETVDQVKEACERFNEANSVAAEAGMTFGIHNHYWEFQMIEDRTVFDRLYDYLDPTVFFEVDTYWVQVGGADPVGVVNRLGERAPILHLKDGPGNREEPMLALGDGVMDIHSVVHAGGDANKWLVVELDRVAADMMTAVERSYSYLVNEGLGHGA
jgi:sugar phosphate isomerase/epimerase